MRTAIRQQSVDAYYRFIGSGARNTQHQQILAALVGKQGGLTRAELVLVTGLPINVVTPRVHELLHPPSGAPKLEELTPRRNASGAKAAPVRLVPPQAEMFPEAA